MRLRLMKWMALAPSVEVVVPELGPHLHLPIRTYSSGMRMRLVFATSTTRHPDILLFDEMISFGDAGFAARAKARLDRMLDRAKVLVLASHDVDSLRTYCNRAVLLEAGSIVGEGSVDQVWQRYIDGVEKASAATIAEVYEDETDAGDPHTRDVTSADMAAR